MLRPLILFLLVLAAGPLIAQDRPAESTAVTVSVAGGRGSGSFDLARTLHVWADPPAASLVFDRWTGDADALVNPLESHTTVLASTRRATISVAATYRAAPTVNATSEPFNGVTLSSFVPPGTLRGVITLHHGTGGSGSNFFLRPEYTSFSADAAAQGFALVALDSLDRVNKQWNTQFAASNPDIQNVSAALQLLTTRGLLPAGLPRYAVGMSNGGGFVPRVSYFLGYAAGTSYCAQAFPAAVSSVPLQWSMAGNDQNENVGSTGNASALSFFFLAASRGVPVSFTAHEPQPVDARRFVRLGLAPADSENVFNAIRAGGFLDAQNFLLAQPDTSGVNAAIPSAYALYANRIVDQLSVCYADHQFYADLDRRTLDFLADPAAAGVRQMPRLVNLSTRAPVLGGDNVLIGGLVVQGAPGVTSRVVVRALGPSLGAAGVAGALSDPTLDFYDAAGRLVASNDAWADGPQSAAIRSAGLAPTDAREPALLLDLAPGGYTAIVRGKDGATGVALVEAYELDATSPARLLNVSTRARVGSGDNVLIGGLVIGGTSPKRMVLRALGASLAAAGVPGALLDPQIELRDAGGHLLALNGDHGTGQQTAELRVARLTPTDPRESALLAWLAPGAYTVIVRGKDGAEGVALVEAYDLP